MKCGQQDQSTVKGFCVRYDQLIIDYFKDLFKVSRLFLYVRGESARLRLHWSGKLDKQERCSCQRCPRLLCLSGQNWQATRRPGARSWHRRCGIWRRCSSTWGRRRSWWWRAPPWPYPSTCVQGRLWARCSWSCIPATWTGSWSGGLQ